MKRIIAIFLVLSLLIVPIHTSAANEVFVGINNVMLPLDNAMPFNSGGVWYIDYTDFTSGDLGINVSYNKDLGTAVLYNWDTTLVFNVGKGTAYKEGSSQVNQRSFFRNGTIYVPASYVCEVFGITFSYISEVSTLRFRTTSGMSDTMFTYIAKKRIPELLAEYNKPAHNPDKPSVEPPKNPDNKVPDNNDETAEQPVKDYTKNNVYITINITSVEKLTQVLNLLSDNRLSATLFLSTDAMGDDNLMRRLCAGNHSLGIYANSTTEASAANSKLYSITKSKSRLLRGDNAITDAEANGYRQWGSNLNALKRNSTQINESLDEMSESVILFDDSETSIKRMKSVFAHINKQKFTVKTISLMTNPLAP